MKAPAATRRAVNLLNLLFTCAALAAAAAIAGGDFTARINKISDDLNKALGDALELDGPNYTDFYENSTYHSRNSFNSKGMAGLYNITNKFMDVIMPKDIYPEGLLKVEGRELQLGSLEEQWQSILAHYGVLLAVLIILVLFAVFMPLCGFCFCCCRCCGNCGARSKPFDKKGDLCRKICLASLLIVFGTLMLFGVVCVFVSNQQMQDGTNDLPENWRTSIKDTDQYLQSTSNQIDVLLNVNYHEFENMLFKTLDKCSNIVLDQLREYSKATALTEVVNIVNGLDDIKSNLMFMKSATNDLRTNASLLNDGLRKVKGDLLQILNECSRLNECNELADKYINQLGTEIDFSNYLDRYFPKLPDISKEINQLSAVLDSNIAGTVIEGQHAFENIQVEINKTISHQIPKVKKSVKKAGLEITAGGLNVTEVLRKAREALYKFSERPMKVAEGYLKYSPYRYYLGLGVGCILLLVTICVTFGLICGICGKRPDAYSDDCCNKGAGSRFLMIGVAIMFLFAIVLTIIVIAHFFVGILAQRLVCDSLRNPNNSQVIDLADKVLNLKDLVGLDGLDVNISWALSSCYKNQSIYKVFKLENRFNLDDVNTYLNKFEINKTLKDLTSQINANTNIVILSVDAKHSLEELVKSGIADIKYDRFTDELAQNLTTVDLGFLANKLNELIDVVRDKVPSIPTLSTRLTLCVMHLRMYQEKFVEPMTAKSKELIVVAGNLKESLKFGKQSFEVAISDLIAELEAAQVYLQLNGSVTMTEIAHNFGYGIERQVRSYLSRVINNTKDTVGQCGPMSAVLNSTMVATCDKILLPWNGFWFSIMWCLLLFIPTIILSVKLATLYQKYEPYPGPLVEAASDKRSKKKYKKKGKRYDGRGAYSAEASSEHGIPRDLPGGSHYQDTRYADMAPKHWEEFPAGGPPQYQRAPTEYERPPPYYYPGTEQQ